mgnify:CR=1 FL=1
MSIPFVQVARPHDDILSGKLTMDVFAADLWQVKNGNAPLEYTDKHLFFKKTYETAGLKNIFKIAKSRLDGQSGDHVIELQTPFGGGKTHTLIALYHMAQEWGANVVVLDGTAFDAKEIRLWEELERQLTGKVDITKGNISPGKDKLVKVLSNKLPVLILMDEVLEYFVKAKGVIIGQSTLSFQTLAFLQELTGAVSSLGNALLVLSLPSSTLEYYDDDAEKVFQQMQKIVGRTEKIYSPVSDEEIEFVIRRRLFKNVDEIKVRDIVDEFVDYARSERLLPEQEVVNYREKFLRSYPFKPEVIETLYTHWGSYPTFQRTRGVLRLLSLVIKDLLDQDIPYIRLGDFNLENDDIREELVKHIGDEWKSVISNDITSDNSGAKRVDMELQPAYLPYKLGTVVSRTIFMLSFSGKGSSSPSQNYIKLSSVYPNSLPSSIIDTSISHLKDKLFYLSDEGLFFTNQPNLNRIMLTREESVDETIILEREKTIITSIVKSERGDKIFELYSWPTNSSDIPDNKNLKVVILNTPEPPLDFLEQHGSNPRVYRNVLLFLCVDEGGQRNFHRFLRKLITAETIRDDHKMSLTDSQKKQLNQLIDSSNGKMYEEFRKCYRKLFVPVRDTFEVIDLGIPRSDENSLYSEIYLALKVQGKLLEKIAPRLIVEKYFNGNKYVELKRLYESFLRTPGEFMMVSEDNFKSSICEGVISGIFGIGYLDNNQIKCEYFKENITVNDVDLDEGVIISADMCSERIEKARLTYQASMVEDTDQEYKSTLESTTEIDKGVNKEYKEKTYKDISLRLDISNGKLSVIHDIVRFLREYSRECTVIVDIKVTDGNIRVSDYENKVKETLQMEKITIISEDKCE